MNKKCGNCGWLTDKCKNPTSVHYNSFRNKEDRCSLKIKRNVVYKFDVEIQNRFSAHCEPDFKFTKCGYMRKNTTNDIDKVTCKLCLRVLEKTV